ncbi:hypothetical protein [Vreelandella arcis]|uniref:hypothetical protein n=1 Tax=Vreelandella arcis TaxID=416873 RepID=UPI001113B333|nr:hypothetical protein [Halomonas arcis]
MTKGSIRNSIRQFLKSILSFFHESALGMLIPNAFRTKKFVLWLAGDSFSLIFKKNRHEAALLNKTPNASRWENVLVNCQTVRITALRFFVAHRGQP